MFQPDHALHGVERFDFQALPFVQFTLEERVHQRYRLLHTRLHLHSDVCTSDWNLRAT